jgi:hypothetical protein
LDDMASRQNGGLTKRRADKTAGWQNGGLKNRSTDEQTFTFPPLDDLVRKRDLQLDRTDCRPRLEKERNTERGNREKKKRE